MINKHKQSRSGEILSPEGIVVFSWATMLDLAGLLDFIPAVGEILTFAVSVVGSLTLGVWSWTKTRGDLQKKLKKNAVRQGLVFAVEAIVPFGSIVPGYIILVLATYFSKD